MPQSKRITISGRNLQFLQDLAAQMDETDLAAVMSYLLTDIRGLGYIFGSKPAPTSQAQPATLGYQLYNSPTFETLAPSQDNQHNYSNDPILSRLGDFVDFSTVGVETATKVVKNQIADTKYQTEQSKLEQTEELLYQQRVATQGIMNLTNGIEDEWQLKFELQGTKNNRLRLEIEGSHRENDIKREELEARLVEF